MRYTLDYEKYASLARQAAAEGCGVAGRGFSTGTGQSSETAAAGSWQSIAPRTSQARPGRQATAASVNAVPPASIIVHSSTARQRRTKAIDSTSIPSQFMWFLCLS